MDALYHYYCEFDAPGLIETYCRPGRAEEPGMVVNFLGVRIPTKVCPEILEPLAGHLEPPPDPGNWHADIAEWAAALLSVDRASECYRIVELGAGWGCWLVNMGAAARSRGLPVDLIGIEGDRGHIANAAEVLALNGFAAGEFSLHHGVAGPRAGQAIFPDAGAGAAGWGGQAVFYPDAETRARAEADPTVQVLECKPLAALSRGQRIDLVHVDIQGAEVDFVTGNLDEMQQFVRRILIGTHSRSIEGRLFDILVEAGWIMEMERPAIAPLHAGRPRLAIDGVQLWRNPKWP